MFPETGDDPWVTDATRLFGDNAHVYSDTDDDIDGFPPDPAPVPADEIAPSAPGQWNYAHVARPASVAGQHCPATPGCSWSNFDTVVQLDGEPRPGGHPALLLREPVPRPPARRRGDRLRRQLGELRGRGPRPGPGRRRRDDGDGAHLRGLPRLRPPQQRVRDPGARRHAAGHAAVPVVERVHPDAAVAQRRELRRRRDDRLPRVHPRLHEPAGHGRGRLPGAQRAAAGGDGRGLRRLVRAGPAQQPGVGAGQRSPR